MEQFHSPPKSHSGLLGRLGSIGGQMINGTVVQVCFTLGPMSLNEPHVPNYLGWIYMATVITPNQYTDPD